MRQRCLQKEGKKEGREGKGKRKEGREGGGGRTGDRSSGLIMCGVRHKALTGRITHLATSPAHPNVTVDLPGLAPSCLNLTTRGRFSGCGSSEHVLDEPRVPHSRPAISSSQKSTSPGMSCENWWLNLPAARSLRGVVLSVSYSLQKVSEGMGPRCPSSSSLGTIPVIGFLPSPSHCPISSWGVLTSPLK